MKQNYKEALSGQIYNNFSNLEDQILTDIVRRIKKTGKITSTADWQINRLSVLGNSTEDIEQMIKEALNASYPEMFELYDKVIDWEYVRSKDMYEQVNAAFIPYEDNKQLQQLTEAFIKQSHNELTNLTQSMGFYLDYGNNNRVFTPLAQIYQKYLDDAVYGVLSGAFDYNTMLRKVVTQLTNSGLRTVDYESGYCSRVPVAARRAVMTGISQLTGKISDANAEILGTEFFEVAWHEGARPAHRVWQGKIWAKEQLVTVCGLGSVTGLLGTNCYHEYYPFFAGISERSWTDDWLEKENRKEDTPKSFKGKGYTAYEASQRQRQMETSMRAQREKVKLLQEGGADLDDILVARCKYQAQLDEYAIFSKKMNLVQQRERVYIDVQGRIAPKTSTSRRVASELDAKYNKGDTLQNFKIYEKDDKLKKKIVSGEIPVKIDLGKQGKHIKGHNNYSDGKSYLTIDENETQKLVEKYAGTGSFKRDRNDKWTNKEFITSDKVIGYIVDPVTGVEMPTSRFSIHYSKNGVHIVPRKEE